MPLLHLSLPPHRLLVGRRRPFAAPMPPPSGLPVRACALPFPPERASHYRELAAAVASVGRACRLCVDVKRTLLSGDRRKSIYLSLNKYLMVASGRASVFVRPVRVKTQIKEAGGQISDWSGEPLDLAADHTGRRIIYPSGGVLVTNSALHDKLVEMISANYK